MPEDPATNAEAIDKLAQRADEMRQHVVDVMTAFGTPRPTPSTDWYREQLKWAYNLGYKHAKQEEDGG